MEFLEKDLEEIIFNADRELLSKKGLTIEGKLYRQLKIGNYGVADLISVKKDYDEIGYINGNIFPRLRITVYELKKDNISISSFLQAAGYLRGIQRFFEKRKVNYEIIFHIVLIGKKIDLNSTFSYLPDLLPNNEDSSIFLSNIIYSYAIDGLKFKYESDYSLIEEGF